MMRTRCLPSADRFESLGLALLFAALLALICVPVASAQDAAEAGEPGVTDEAGDNRGNVTEGERIAFDQERAYVNMRELEDRMFRLAEMIAGDEPEEAQRLRLGVETARGAALADRMRQVADVLTGMQTGFDGAAAEQAEILAELTKLRALLLQADVDLELAIQRLEQMNETAANLAALAEAEAAQQEATDAMAAEAEANGGEPSEAEAGELAESEQRNQAAAEQLEAEMAQQGGAAAQAAESVGQAGESMGEASESLSQGSPSDASGEQGEAREQLERAQEQMDQAQQEQQERVEALAKKRVMENLQDMLAGQIAVREAVERLAPRADQGLQQAVMGIERQAIGEDELIELCAKTIEVCEVVQFSVAMPPALGLIRDRMEWVSEDLRTPRWDESVIASMARIENDLAELIDAMKMQQQASNEEGQSGQCGGAQGDMNEILAEVRILRMLQVSVNQQTASTEDDRKAELLLPSEADRRVDRLLGRQEQVREATELLRERTAG